MDLTSIQTLLTQISILVPVTTGVIQAIKMAGFPLRFLPLLSVVLGAGFGVLFISYSVIGIFGGLAIGLASVGLFEFGKTTVLNG